MKRKITVLVLCFILFFELFSISASSFNSGEYIREFYENLPTVYRCGDWNYTLSDDGTACIYGKRDLNADLYVIYHSAYLGNEKDITIPSELDGHEVTSIATGAFKESSVENVIIPDSVVSMEKYAFYGCETLRSVYIPGSLEKISKNAFNSCTSLSDVTMCEGITEIEGGAFLKTAVSEFDFPESLRIIRDAALSTNALEYLVIPDWVEVVDPKMATGPALKSITIPENNTEYCTEDGVVFNKGKTILYYVPRSIEMTEYSVPYGVTTIGFAAFEYVSTLTDIVLPDTVTTIDENAFYGCSNLKTINIPDGVKSLETATFSGCRNLESIDIGEGLEIIEDAAFDDCESLKSLYLPASLEWFGEWDRRFAMAITNCYSLEEFIVSPDNQYYSAIDGVLYSKDQTQMYLYPAGKKKNYLAVPSSVESISDSVLAAEVPVETIYGFGDGTAKEFASNAGLAYSRIGDLDEDNVVSSNDYAMLQSAVLCNSSLEGSKEVQADINLDGSVDGIDAIQLCLMNNEA